MPTGYTCIIDDNPNTTLRQFMLRCVRGMGVCMEMRDDPLEDLPPKVLKPDTTYSEKRLAESQERLQKLKNMSVAEVKRACIKDNCKTLEAWEKCSEESAAVRQRYLAMKQQVEAWTPPTSQHQGYKEFMLEQLVTGGMLNYEHHDHEPEAQSPDAWLADEIRQAKDDVQYYTKDIEKTLQRYRKANEWLEQFWASLPEE
ncbi:MAG: hypothetical protein WC505_05955 [Patescibacteria group bacterium]